MSKSGKFRKLLEEEEYLRNQLSDCVTSQYRMLRKAFNGLGLKLGHISEMYDDQSIIKVAETTDWSVRYYRNTGVRIKIHEISFEDLFDAEVE